MFGLRPAAVVFASLSLALGCQLVSGLSGYRQTAASSASSAAVGQGGAGGLGHAEGGGAGGAGGSEACCKDATSCQSYCEMTFCPTCKGGTVNPQMCTTMFCPFVKSSTDPTCVCKLNKCDPNSFSACGGMGPTPGTTGAGASG